MPRSAKHSLQIKRWKRKYRAHCTEYERNRRTRKRLAEQGVELSREVYRVRASLL